MSLVVAPLGTSFGSLPLADSHSVVVRSFTRHGGYSHLWTRLSAGRTVAVLVFAEAAMCNSRARRQHRRAAYRTTRRGRGPQEDDEVTDDGPDPKRILKYMRGRGGKTERKAAAPNSRSAATLLKQRRQRSMGKLQSELEESERTFGGQEPRPSPRQKGAAQGDAGDMPTRIATWHAHFKSMNASRFFDTVSSKPDLLHAYTRQARLEGINSPEDKVLHKTARLVHDLVLEPLRSGAALVADLGCGEAALARKLAVQDWPDGRVPEVTSVDAASLAPGVCVQNLAELPSEWTGRFDVVVLCRALWSRDVREVLVEARRVLSDEPSSRLLVVDPLKKWWSKDEYKNALLPALESAGFDVMLDRCSDIEPPTAGQHEEVVSSSSLEGVFQYIVAAPSLRAGDAAT